MKVTFIDDFVTSGPEPWYTGITMEEAMKTKYEYVDPNKSAVKYRVEVDWMTPVYEGAEDTGHEVMTFKTKEGALRYVRDARRLKLGPVEGKGGKIRIIKVTAKSRKIGDGVVKADSTGSNIVYRAMSKNFNATSSTYTSACDALRKNTKK
jgi:hypothetical protein